MANKNPHQARKAKSQKRVRSGDLAALRLKHWKAILLADELLSDDSQPVEVRMKAGHMLTQSVGAYSKLIEALEMESRMADLEKQIKEGGLLR